MYSVKKNYFAPKIKLFGDFCCTQFQTTLILRVLEFGRESGAREPPASLINFSVMSKEFVMTDSFRRELESLVENAVSNAIEKQKAKSALMRTEDVMKAYGVSRTTIWRLAKSGTLHAIQGRGRQQLYNAEECKRVLIKESAKAENK